MPTIFIYLSNRNPHYESFPTKALSFAIINNQVLHNNKNYMIIRFMHVNQPNKIQIINLTMLDDISLRSILSSKSTKYEIKL